MNFTYLQNNSDLSVLFSCCKECEEFARNHPNISITAARKTVEYIVKLLYGTKINSDIRGLSLYEMLSDYDFREYLNDKTLLDAIHFIRRKGNQAVHEGNMNHDEAMEVLEKLHYVVGEVCIKLGVIDRYPPFDPEILESCAQGTVSIAGEPEVDGALIKRLSERTRNRMKSAAHSKGDGRISNVHVSTTKEARALSQHKITRGTDSGANGKSAYQYLGGYIAKLLPDVQILMENVRSELILIKDNKGTIFAVKTGCANLGTKDYDGNWQLLHGVDYVLYAPDVTEEHPIEVQFRLFSRDAFIKFWEEVGLLRMKVSTAMRRRIVAQMGPDEKITTDKYADVISIQSFANSGRKLPLVTQNLIGYPRLSDVDWNTIL